MKHAPELPKQEKIAFTIPHIQECFFSLLPALVWAGFYCSPGNVSPLTTMTNVNPAGTHQAVAKMLFEICPLIYKEKMKLDILA